MEKREAYILIVLVSLAIIARVIGINWRPPSNDEMGHIFYAIQALHGSYQYNPEWHGPFEHYLIALCLLAFPFSKDPFLSIAVIRFVYSIFSIIAGVVVFLFLRDYLSLSGRLVATSLILLSPEILYYSRFIHESALMAPIMLSSAVFAIRYLKDLRPRYLYLASFFFTLGFITKESWIIYLGIWGSFFLILLISAIIRKDAGFLRDLQRLKGKERAKEYLISLGIFLSISFIFYSSFGRNPYGIVLGFLGPLHWVHRVHAHIIAPFYYWFDRIWLYDLYLIPAVIYVGIKEKDDTTVFFIYWFVVSFAFYSYIQEKLPRLMANITIPGMIVAGKALDDMLDLRGISVKPKEILKKVGTVAFVALVALSFWQSCLVNYVNYDNPIEPLIYPKLPHQWYSLYYQVWEKQKKGEEVRVAICWPQQTFGYVNVFSLWFTYVDPTYYVPCYFPSELSSGNYTYIILYSGYLSQVDKSLLKEYKVEGPYPVLEWVFHEEWTTKTTLGGFIKDFSHYLDPSFYFLRRYTPPPDRISCWSAYLLVKKRKGEPLYRNLYKLRVNILVFEGEWGRGEDI